MKRLNAEMHLISKYNLTIDNFWNHLHMKFNLYVDSDNTYNNLMHFICLQNVM